MKAPLMRLPLILVPAVVGLSLLAYSYGTRGESILSPLGYWRPFYGFEHLLAAVGIGGWAALLKGHAYWALPLAFLVGAGLGVVMAWEGQGDLPFVGLMLFLSIVSLVLATLLPVRMPIERAAALVALFGVYHGYAYSSATEPLEAALSMDIAAGGMAVSGPLVASSIG
jgi:urease accessory protein